MQHYNYRGEGERRGKWGWQKTMAVSPRTNYRCWITNLEQERSQPCTHFHFPGGQTVSIKQEQLIMERDLERTCRENFLVGYFFWIKDLPIIYLRMFKWLIPLKHVKSRLSVKPYFCLELLFLGEGVNYLSWTHAYYVAIRTFFDKYSLRTKGLFHLSQKSGTKV